MACTLKYKTAKANAKNFLMSKGVIDKNFRILDYKGFLRYNKELSDEAQETYKINTKWFYTNEAGNIAIPNEAAFYAVDIKNNVRYQNPGVDPSPYLSMSPGRTKRDMYTINEVMEFWIPVISHLGIEIQDLQQYFDDYKLRTGKEFDTDRVEGIADLINKTLAYNGDPNVFSEEMAHFILAAVKKDFRFQRAMDAVVNTKLYQEKAEIYRDKYKKMNPELTEEQVEEKVKIEILGQQMNDHVFRGLKGEIRIKRLLKALFNKFLSLFDKRKKAVKELEEFFDPIIENIKNKNFDGLDTTFDKSQFSTEALYLSVSEAGMDKSELVDSKLMDKYKKELKNILKILEKKIEVYKRTYKSGAAKAEGELYKKLGKRFRDNAITLGLIEAAEDLDAKTKLIDDKFKAFIKGKDNMTLQEQARYLRDNRQYLESFNSIYDSLYSSLYNDEALNPDDVNLKKLRGYIGAIKARLDSIESNYYKQGKFIIAKTLWPWVEKNPNINSIDELQDALERAPRDLSIFQRWLDSMAESHDDILGALDQLVKKHKNRAQAQTLEKTAAILEADRKFKQATGEENAEFAYEVDSNGKKTLYAITALNRGEYENELRMFAKELEDKYGLPPNKTIRSFFLENFVDSLFKNFYKDAKNKSKVQELEKKIPTVLKGEKRRFMLWKLIKQEYARDWQGWFNENQEPAPNVEKVIRGYFRKMWTENVPEYLQGNKEVFDEILNNVGYFNDKPKKYKQKEYNLVQQRLIDFIYDNTVRGTDGEIIHTNMLGVPNKKKYKNEQYFTYFNEDGSAKPGKEAYVEYYNFMMETKDELDKLLPFGKTDPFLMPQKRKDWFERLRTKDKALLPSLWENIKDVFKIRQDDTEFGDETTIPTAEEQKLFEKYERTFSLTDENNIPVQMIPTHFTQKLKDPSDLSIDLASSMALYANMAYNYKEMNSIVDTLEVAGDLLQNRTIGKEPGSIQKFLADLLKKSPGEKVNTKKRGGLAYDRYKDYMDMMVYGEIKKRETWLGPNTTKILDAFNTYTAMQMLGFNVYSALQNPLLGNALILQEQKAKDYLDKGALKYADKQFWSQFKDVIDDVGQPMPTSKLGTIMMRLDVTQDYMSRMYGIEADRTRLSRLFNLGSAFFMNHAGEYFMQARMMLALMKSTPLEIDGNKVNLWEALEVENGVVKIKEGTKFKNKKGELVDFTEDDLNAFKNKLSSVNKRLHGVYDQIDRSAIQAYVIGRWALLFRKFIKSGWNRRYETTYWNYDREAESEGMYYSTLKYLQHLRNEQFNHAAAWKQLKDFQKSNVRRTLWDVGMLSSALILGSILLSIEAGDDDELTGWALNMLAFQANRHFQELAFFVNPIEGMKVLQSPAVALNQMERTMGIVKAFDVSGAIFSGDPLLRRYKGGPNVNDLYLSVWTKRAIPFVSTLEKTLNPDEKVRTFFR